MKILHVITRLHVGGAELMLAKLVASMDARRFEHVVVSLVDGGDVQRRLTAQGVPVHTLGLQRGAVTPAALIKLRRLFGRIAPQVVQGWMYHGNLAATAATGAGPGSPRLLWNIRHCVYDIRGEKSLTQSVIRLGALLSGLPERIVYNAQISLEQHARLGYRRRRALVIPNGFDTDAFRPDPAARAALRSRLGLAGDPPLVGMLGRNHPQKGQADFLRAAALVHGRRPDVHFICAGPGVRGGDQDLAGIRSRLAAADRVHLLDDQEDPAGFLAGLDVLCLPSLTEGFPNVLGEAMACAVPCVATDVGEAAIILDGVGSVVAPGVPRALADALLGVLDMDPAVRADLGARGRLRVQQRYALGAVARRYEELYGGG